MYKPGTATDALVRRTIETRDDRGEFTIIRSPENPKFWFANCLLLKTEPARATYDAWLAECARCFAGVPVSRLVVTWEVAGLHGVTADTGSLTPECAIVFTTRSAPCYDGNGNPREFKTASDWSEALALITPELVSDDVENLAKFEAWRFSIYQRDVATGRCLFWGLWLDGRLAAYTGLYFDANWARFVTPVTHHDYRRRGLFRTLASYGIRSILRTNPDATIVIAAERDSYAASIYKRMGFAAVGEQHALIAMPDSLHLD